MAPGWIDCREWRRNQTLSHVALSQISNSRSGSALPPTASVRKFTFYSFSKGAWQLAYLKSQMAIHRIFFVVAQSWAGTCVSSPRAPSWPGRVEKWAHPVFPLQTRHSTLDPRKASTITGQALKRNKRC